MSAPLISVLVMMSRPGGVDITLAGMRDQTFKDFELIIVDSRYERRHKLIEDMAKEYGIERVICAPEHRRNGEWIVAATGFNTAIALARGQLVIILHDFAYAHPGWIEGHLAAHADGIVGLAAADHMNVDLPDVDVAALDHTSNLADRLDTDRACMQPEPSFEATRLGELCIFKRGLFDASWLPLPISSKQWQPGLNELARVNNKPEHGWITLTNDSASRDLLLALNGIDERYDHGRGPFDADLGVRIEKAGARTRWLEQPQVTLLNPRFLMRTRPFGSHTERVPGRWTAQDCKDYYNIVKFTSPTRIRAGNPYDLRLLSQQLEPWRQLDAVRVPQDLSDLAYWREVVTPGTAYPWR